jgi:inner membrane protein
MEPVTHFLTGAVLARAGFNRRTAYATLAMTLAAEAPDLDVLWGLRGPVALLEHHRGITHTFLGAPLVALAVTATVYGWHKLRSRKKPGFPSSLKAGAPRLEPETWEANSTSSRVPVSSSVGLSGQKPNWLLLWLFSLIAALSHILLDFTNNYGVRPFFPFNPRWYSWDIVSIFEPLIFAALLGALIMPAIFGLADREIGARRTPFRGRGWAIAALAFVAILYTVRNAEHRRALGLLRAATLSEPLLRAAAMPYPINPFRWQGLAETADFFQTANIDSHSDTVDTDSGRTFYKPPVTLATLAAKRSYLGHIYLDWSQWPIVTDMGSLPASGSEAVPDLSTTPPDWHTVEFRDLRFLGPNRIPGSKGAPPLSGFVYIGPQNEVEAILFNGREQK